MPQPEHAHPGLPTPLHTLWLQDQPPTCSVLLVLHVAARATVPPPHPPGLGQSGALPLATAHRDQVCASCSSQLWPPSLAHTFPDTCPNKPPHTPSRHQVRLWPALSSPRFWFTAPSTALCPCSRPLSEAPAGSLQDGANTQRGTGSTRPSMLAGVPPGRNPLNSKFQARGVHTKWPAQSLGSH